MEFTLGGLHTLDVDRPLALLSFFEADAYDRGPFTGCSLAEYGE